jgi:hypothetical protein
MFHGVDNHRTDMTGGLRSCNAFGIGMKIVTIVILPCHSMLLAQLKGVVGQVDIVQPVKCIGSSIKSLQELGEWWQTDVHSWGSSNECTYEWLLVLQDIKQMNGGVTFQQYFDCA